MKSIPALLFIWITLSESVAHENEATELFCQDGVCTKVSNEPPIDPCHDTHTDCEFWASIGECHVNPNYMLNNCAKSCGMCPSIQRGDGGKAHAKLPCSDEISTEECEKRAQLGKCLLDPTWMKQNCKATCIYCANEEQLRLQGATDDEILRRHRYLSMNQGQSQGVYGNNLVERHHNVEQIKAMENYAKTVLTTDSVSTETRARCKNSIGQCAYYASKGMCESNTVFMMNNCPLACMMCENLNDFHENVGKIHPFQAVPSMVKDEDIHYIEHPEEIDLFSIGSFFNFTSSEYKDRIHVLSTPTTQDTEDPDDATSRGGDDDPWIVQIDNILSEHECDHLMEELGRQDTVGGWKNSTAIMNKFDNFNGLYWFQIPLRSSQSLLNCDEASHTSTQPCANPFITSQTLPKLSELLHIPESYFEIPQIDHYPPGGYYTLHHDYRIPDVFHPAGPRVLSLYLVLSEPTSGGWMGFPHLNFLMVRPTRGSMLLLSNVRGDDLSFQPLSRKEILPVREGDLYLLHTHIRLYPFQAQPTTS